MTITDNDEVRRETRLYQLLHMGFGQYREVVQALDRLKARLSPDEGAPKSDTPQSPQMQLVRLLEASLELSNHDAPVRMTARLNKEKTSIELTMRLPDEDLVDYFLDVTNDTEREDPLGVRSLFGVLHINGVGRVLASFTGDLRARHEVFDLGRGHYQRQFRRSGTPGARLRQLIDRVLWSGERVYLNEELAQVFSNMSEERAGFLNELGLMMMPDEEGRYELFVPRPERQRQRGQVLKVLRRIVRSIEYRIDTGNGREFTLSRDSQEEKVRFVFGMITEQDLMKREEFLRLISQASLRCEVKRNEDGSMQAIRFIRKHNEAQIKKEPVREITESDFPPGLLPLFHIATHMRRNQLVPNTEENCAFLVRPEVQRFLQKRGVSVSTSQVLPSGTFESAPYFYVEGLVASDAEGLGDAPRAALETKSQNHEEQRTASISGFTPFYQADAQSQSEKGGKR